MPGAGSGPSAGVAARTPSWGRALAYRELTKPGITRLVLLTTTVGFYLASRGAPDLPRLLHTLIGTGLVAAGTNALNQYAERAVDARMRRTGQRPLPSGRLTPAQALRFAVTISLLGLGYLIVTVGLATALIVAFSLASYIFLYTPLKRRTSLATLVGAVPGALPILAGWVAAGGRVGPAAWALCAILFLWQFPHFLALAWLYREDYGRAGLRMLSVLDPDGRRTGRQIVLYTLALLPASLLPSVLGVTGPVYFLGALLLGVLLLLVGAAMARGRTRRQARRLFLASVAYLPALLLLMVLDKLPG